jgi:DNA-binding NarL/FixJ family response regulator
LRKRGTTAEARGRPPVVPMLGRWGLSPDADLIYRRLVLLGPSSRPQLGRQLGVAPARVGQALDELAAAGAVRHSHRGGEGEWSAVDVDVVLARVRRHRSPVVIGDRYRQHLAVVAGLRLETVPAVAVHRMPTRAAARRRIADLAVAERHEHLAINTEDVISAAAAAAASPLDRALVARGVRLRTLGFAPRDGSPDRPLVAGGEHRRAENLPLKLMVFDRRNALFPADPADFEAGAIEIDDPDAVAQLTQLFYRIWHAVPHPRDLEVPPIVLTSRDHRIVSLLAAGLSEEAVAIELGISRRTVAYALRALMDRLGVENRFQLALLLGAANAVPLPPTARQPEGGS